MCPKLLNLQYRCEVWVKSSDPQNIRIWSKIFPVNKNRVCVGLPTRSKQFTLVRSPLGSKASKDQYELVEYGCYYSFWSDNASIVLKLFDTLNYPMGVKLKICLSTGYT